MNFSFKFFILILIPKLFISQNNYFKDNNFHNDAERIFQLPKIVYNILRETIQDAIPEWRNLSQVFRECISKINNTYSFPESLSVTKLYEGSSKGFIDLSSFSNCIDSNDKSENNESESKINGTEPVSNDTNSLNKEIESNNQANKEHYFYTVYPKLNHKQKIAISKFDEKSVFNHSWIFGFFFFF